MELQKNTEIELRIQFQMDHLPSCKMHLALDHFDAMDLLFPNTKSVLPNWTDEQNFEIKSEHLNHGQRKVVQQIMSEGDGIPHPMIICGPFGTGKTETLAQAAMLLAVNKKGKVLVCTHSNSAADLFVTRYLHKMPNTSPDLKMLRVYHSARRLETIDPLVRKYCVLSDDGRSLLFPSWQTINEQDIIITTLTTCAYFLQHNELKGAFSHIFVDEAAQVLESEVLMALSLASKRTRVVLAGDHIQLKPEVYSPDAKKQEYNSSILERLFLHYNKSNQENNQCCHILNVNYRTCADILCFIAKVFYGGPENLVPGTKFEPYTSWPLAFFGTQGAEMQDPDSTTYYNMSETNEIVSQVQELCTYWPSEWGECKPEDIGVIACYEGQVSKIRSALRKKGLDRVNVGLMISLQGKEFRAVFISTVRTRYLTNITAPAEVMNYGFLSDPHLVNTAMTRAQCFVGVVGDPVALCYFGECSGIWTAFLNECRNYESLFPQDLSVMLDSIHMQQLETTLIENKTFAEAAYPTDSLSKQEPQLQQDIQLSPSLCPPKNNTKPTTQEWNYFPHIKPDDIIKQLATQAKKVSEKMKVDKQYHRDDDETPLKVEYIQIKERESHAVISYKPPSWCDKRRKRKLLGADDWDKQYSSDSDSTDNEEKLLDNSEYSHDELLSKIQTKGSRYRKCRLVIISSARTYAKVLDPASKTREIKISSRKRCGRGFNNDIVVVEILSVDEDEAKKMKDTEVQGKVIGILKRAFDPLYRRFVCFVDEENVGLMMPLNRGVPQMHCLTIKDRLRKSQNSKAVCIYKLTSDKTVEFDKYESLYDENHRKKLFVVRFLKWDVNFVSPLCIVTGTIPSGTSMETGIEILNIEHFVPNKFKNDVNEEIQHIMDVLEAPHEGRHDLRNQLVFTIDPEESEDLDDGLSIRTIGNGCHEIGIHIADVSHFIKKDSVIDKEAYTRGVTFYPAGHKPINMLPDLLSTDVCSLQPGKDKLTLSLMITINRHFDITKRHIQRSIIKNKSRLSYSEAEIILDGFSQPQDNPDLPTALQLLYKISNTWRKQRLGNASFYFGLDKKSAECPKAHLLVEELMITANKIIAEELMKNFPNCTPLRVQDPPDDNTLDEWKQAHFDVAYNSPVLRQSHLPRGIVCKCNGICTCVATNTSNKYVSVRTELWEKLTSYLNSDTVETVINNIVSPRIQPDCEVALIKLHQLQEQATYVCSGDVTTDEQEHHSLLTNRYTHFTSPIRRYIDLVVHCLISAMLDGKPCPYTQEQISSLCQHCTEANQRSRQYEKETEKLQIATLLKENPVILYPVVETVTESMIQTRSPNIKCLPTTVNRIPMTSLQPHGEPYIDDNNSVIISWQERIYENGVDFSKQPHASSLQNELTLDSERYITKIPTNLWQKLLCAAITGKLNDIKKACNEAKDSARQSSMDKSYTSDVSSEVLGIAHTGQVCKFSIAMNTGRVIKVQLSADVFRGLLSPCLQLMELTPTLHICLEHRSNPVECFLDSEPIKASRQTYKDIDQYKMLWLKLVQVEAAFSSVTDGDTIIIHNVFIKWKISTDSSELLGTFELPLSFCKDRGVLLSSFDDDEMVAPGQTLDFICVRYTGQLPEHPSISNQLHQYDLDTTQPITWVGHCVSTSVVNNKTNETVKVTMKLVHKSVPMELMQKTNKHTATLEIIPKSKSSRREEHALAVLGDDSRLASDIALEKRPEGLSEVHIQDVKKFRLTKIKNMAPANQSQQEAIDMALTEPYTLIQGPPGTGKTLTGVRLATMFALFNRMQPSSGDIRPQVMYCGPSNKSVDVVTAYLLRQADTCPKMVRIYSKMIERHEFPLPMDVLGCANKKKSSFVKDVVLEKTTMHHMIRDKQECSLASEIRKTDDVIKRCIQEKIDLSEKEKLEYHDMIKKAKLEVMKTKEIILCTCHTSSGDEITSGTNVKQLIIDECGMCTEPESMIPIVVAEPQQVILIGDHKQLRPIVRNQRAKRLGLETSLFERQSKLAKMLSVQYRMHEAIAEFPSVHFYNNQLKTGSGEQHQDSRFNIWPNGRNKPIVFVHTVGSEESLSVSTEEGSVQSKSNMQEVDKTVRVVFHLVKNLHIQQKDILILSQYRAQVYKIAEKLKQSGLSDVNVNSVVAAQGSECDYVILSTVRSLPSSHIDRGSASSWRRRHMGFITDEHQINVALTRAKKGFFIIGNKNLLECHPMWRKLIEYYRTQKKLVDTDRFMNY